MSDVVTPMQIERRLRELGKELDEVYSLLHQWENEYMDAKTAYELSSAKSRMSVRQRGIERGTKLTVQEIEDQSLLDCRQELTRLNIAEGMVRSMRANNTRVRTQIDIARSVGTTVRASLEM